MIIDENIQIIPNATTDTLKLKLPPSNIHNNQQICPKNLSQQAIINFKNHYINLPHKNR